MFTVLHGTGFYFNVAGQGKPLRAGAQGKEEGKIMLRLLTSKKYLRFCLVCARLLQRNRYGNGSLYEAKPLQIAE